MTIKVLLVDNHLVVLQGLRFFLNTQTDIEIVGEAINGEEAIEKVIQLKPDIVLMDLQMPVLDGIEATKRIKAAYPKVKVIVLTSYYDQDHVLPALRAGATGYQLKDIKPDELVNVIRRAYQGETQLHPIATNLLLSTMVTESGQKEIECKIAELTKRELDVLEQITLGKNNKEIATELFISETTVKTHVSSILSKLAVSDRTQAAIFAIEHQLFEK